jgi:predicted short-subunit dehydrogenase-like oxidoreductase (DUF2520 family)
MNTLNIIGCGSVGKTLGRLFHQAQVFEVGDILTRSLDSAQSAAGFIGSGRPISGFAEMRPAELYMIAACDDAIAGCAADLAATGLVGPGTIVCHLSGALPSSLLAPVASLGALVASVHPVKSFADPLDSVASFAGTWCGIEGDAPAVACLGNAFSGIGGKMFSVDARFKTIYHVGSVLACNYLTALVETGVRAYCKGGLSEQIALEVMEPLVRGTLDNIFRTGTVQALTGPIARGDCAVVARQLEALDAWDGDISLIYRALGGIALDLSELRGTAAQADLTKLREVLGLKGEQKELF